MSGLFLLAGISFAFCALIAVIFDMQRIFAVFGIIAILFSQLYSNATASEQREQMHQCLKDGGQWMQYSRSGFECVRAER
jgi:uncharacterized membrane protein